MAPTLPPPPWVLDKLRELVEDGLTVPLCAAQLDALGHPCTPRQVRRWKAQLSVRRFAKLSDAQLDVVVQRVRDEGGAGAREGYRWIQSAINEQLKPLRVGRDRIRKSLLRLAPEEVAERRSAVEKRIIRRVYVADYYGQSGHLDFNCKATLPGGIKLYTYGHVDGDSRWIAALEVTFVKTAKASFEHGFLRALEADAYAVSDVVHMDAGREWSIIAFMAEQELKYKVVKSTRNVKVERPWGDYNVKCVGLLRDAAWALKEDGEFDGDDVHDQYGLRVAAKLTLQAAANEFRARYNEHNVAGPRGGVPSTRRKYRTRPAGTPPAATFDVSRDWPREYAAWTGRAYHAEDHIAQIYSERIVAQLPTLQQPLAPTADAAWCDVKVAEGRVEFLALFRVACEISRTLATAESIVAAEKAESLVRRGAKAFTEDPVEEDDDGQEEEEEEEEGEEDEEM